MVARRWSLQAVSMMLGATYFCPVYLFFGNVLPVTAMPKRVSRNPDPGAWTYSRAVAVSGIQRLIVWTLNMDPWPMAI